MAPGPVETVQIMGVETLLKMLPDAYKWYAHDFELASNSFKHFEFVSPLRTVLLFLWLYIFMPSDLSSILLKYLESTCLL